MASKQSNVDFVLEQMADAGPVSARKMFGEYAIYRGHKVIALFCDDQLFVKPTKVVAQAKLKAAAAAAVRPKATRRKKSFP